MSGLPVDPQMIDAGVLVPLADHDTMTIDSPLDVDVDGAEKVQPHMLPEPGQHSDDILREARCDEAAITGLHGRV